MLGVQGEAFDASQAEMPFIYILRADECEGVAKDYSFRLKPSGLRSSWCVCIHK